MVSFEPIISELEFKTLISRVEGIVFRPYPPFWTGKQDK